MRRYMTVEEASAHFDVHFNTLTKWRKMGAIKASMVSGRLAYDLESVDTSIIKKRDKSQDLDRLDRRLEFNFKKAVANSATYEIYLKVVAQFDDIKPVSKAMFARLKFQQTFAKTKG